MFNSENCLHLRQLLQALVFVQPGFCHQCSTFNMQTPTLEQIFTNKQAFKTSDYIKSGFTLVNRHWMVILAFMLMVSFISFIVSILTGAVLLSLPVGSSVYTNVFTSLLNQLIPLAISAPLMLGYYIAAHQSARQQPLDFDMLFGGFKQFLTIFLAEILLTILILISCMGGIFLLIKNSGDVINIQEILLKMGNLGVGALLTGLLMTFIPGLIVVTLTIYTPCFVRFLNLSAIDAIKFSFRLSAKYFFPNLIFMLIWGAILLLPMLIMAFLLYKMMFASGIILFVLYLLALVYIAPVIRASIYAAFADLTRLNEQKVQELDALDHFSPVTPA